MDGLKRDVDTDIGFSHAREPQRKIREQVNSCEEGARVQGHRRGAAVRAFAKRGLVAFLAFSMVFSTTPTQMWADGVAGIADAVEQRSENDGAEKSGDASTETPSKQGEVAGADLTDAQVGSENKGAATSTDGDKASVAADDSKIDAYANRARANATLNSKNGVSVGTNKAPARWAGSNYPGFIQTKTTLYASAWSSSTGRVTLTGCTYQWLSADVSHRNDADCSAFVPVEGQTGSSIVLDDALRTQLNGQCLRVRITDASGNVVYGPSKSYSNQTLTATNTIKAPVKDKTALDAKSYVLIQASSDETKPTAKVDAAILRSGTTLWANAYDSEAVPSKRIAAQTGWTYQWLASKSRDAKDADYQPIAGQTGQSLTLTDELAAELAGKYIRVKVTGDGQTLYGPSGSFDTPASIGYNTPGPVAASDQIALGHIVLAYNGAEFGDDYENTPTGNVGDTIKAAAYYLDYDSPTDLYGSDQVDFTWWVADSEDGTFEKVATGDTFTVTEQCAHRYLKVTAKAKHGIPGSDSCESKPGRILPKGASTLYYVDYTNASKAAKDTGTTIEAMAYKGDYWSSEPVTSGVTYTWRWSSVDPKSDDFNAKTDWHVIKGQTGSSFTIPSDYANRWVSVSANAGDNTVEADNAVAVKAAGSHELYFASLKKVAGDLNERFVYKTGDKIGISAFEKSSAGTKGEELAGSQLTYTWQIADNAVGPYTTLTDGNAHRSSFIIPAKYVGKYLKCVVSGGYNAEGASTRYAIAEGKEVGTFTLSSVSVASSGNIAQVDGTLTPTANYMVKSDWGDYESAVPGGTIVDYQWYVADDAKGTNAHELDGANESTGTLVLPASTEGKYVYVVANAGDNDVKSEPLKVSSSEVKTISVNVRVQGVSKHDAGRPYDVVNWVPQTAFDWKSNQKLSAWDIFSKVLDNAGYTYSTDGGVPYSITTPDKSQTLEMGNTTYGYKYWRFDINGKSASVYATGYFPTDGDTIELVYEDPTGEAQTAASCEIIGQDGEGHQQTWTQPFDFTVKEGETAANLTEELFKKTGVKAKCGIASWGGWSLDSVTSPYDSDVTLAYNPNTGAYWQLFINGEYASVGAGGYTLKPGDKISWVYGNDGAMPGQISVSMEVIGQDSAGTVQRWTDPSNRVFLKGTSILDASDEYFTACGLDHKFVSIGNIWGVAYIVSPFDSTVRLPLDWTLFINGVKSDDLPDDYELKSGDKLVWAYAAGDTIPDPDKVDTDPDASRPSDWTADWSGHDNATTDAATPTGTAAATWTFDYQKYSGASYASASEPIVVNGSVYLAVNKRLLKIDAETGKVAKSANLEGSVGYTSRPVYANGLILVPLDGGAVQALTADTLKTVWTTKNVSDLAQSNSVLNVQGNFVYVGTVDVNYAAGTYDNGHLMCIRISDGKVVWDHVNAAEGYYWTGATVTDAGVLIPTSAGTVELLDHSTGKVLSTCKVGSIVNSTVVASKDGKTFYLMSRDGKLHVMTLTNGQLTEKTVDLGLTGCACMPTVSGNTMYVGGVAGKTSALAIVDLNTLKANLITSADGGSLPPSTLNGMDMGGVKGAPLVSELANGTYVYFTVNYGTMDANYNYSDGGGVYCYKVGDKEAKLIFDPAGHFNCCDSPVACDKNGNLYYINDSGTLFRLNAGIKVSFDSEGGSTVKPDSLIKGDTAKKPGEPTRDGYKFGGWFTDAACTKAYDFSKAVTEALTLYAKWIKVEKPGKHDTKPTTNGKPAINGKPAAKPKVSVVTKTTGTVAPSNKPVSKNSSTPASKSPDKKGAKAGKKAASNKKKQSGKKNGTAHKNADEHSTKATAVQPERSASLNPLAIVGIVTGVIGLVLIIIFLTKKRGEEE